MPPTWQTQAPPTNAPGGGPWPTPPEGWVPDQPHQVISWGGNQNTMLGNVTRAYQALNGNNNPDDNITRQQAMSPDFLAAMGYYANPEGVEPGWYTAAQGPPGGPEDPSAGGGGGGRGGGGGGGGAGGGGGGGGFGGGGGGSSPGVAQAYHSQASLIDMNDPIFSLFAPKPWMSGMLSMGREYTQAATEDALRLQRDQAVRSGISTSSPAYLYMVAMQRRNQQQQLSNALREAQLAWTLPAANRRAGALGDNAQLGTQVGIANADASTRVSMANAGYATQSSIANAGNATQAGIAAGQLGLGYATLGQQASQFQTTTGNTLAQQNFENIRSLYGLQSQGGGQYVPPGSPDYLGAANQGIGLGQGFANLFGNGGGGGSSQPVYNPNTVTPDGGYAVNYPG